MYLKKGQYGRHDRSAGNESARLVKSIKKNPAVYYLKKKKTDRRTDVSLARVEWQ